MNVNAIPRIVAPVALAAAILLSFHSQENVQPIELQGAEPPEPPAAQVASAFESALQPGAPGYDRGAKHAPVTVIEFADFGCRYCAQFALATYPTLADEFVKSGKVRWKYVPFVLGMFPNGDQAARAAECAADQGTKAFDRMHDQLFRRQGEWSRNGDPTGLFRSYAQAAGLDTTRFTACYAGHEPDGRIRASNELADRMGVRATPTFFVNGYRIEGALPAEQFRTLLNDALRQSSRH